VPSESSREPIPGVPTPDAPLPTGHVSVPMPDGRLSMDGYSRWILSAVPAVAERVPYVRQQAAAVLALWELSELATTVELLLTELVTNVVRHARTPFTVILAWTGRTLRCEVSDVNPDPPMAQLAIDVERAGGRGLLLIDQLATDWGVEHHPQGKTVWFDLRAA
jgi:anti-sigma regulatory factor (Ser/Thr protein kinase)